MARTLRTVLSIDTKRFKSGLNNAKASVRGFNQAVVRPLGQAIRRFVRLGAIVAGVGAAFAAFGIKAAASIQQAQLRMAGVSTGVEDFKRTWQDMSEVFLRSPLELDQAAGAMTALKGAGVGTKSALESVAAAALLLNRPVEDLSRVLIGMESQVLRKLMIRSRSVGKGMNTAFQFEMADRAGNSITRVADSIEEARKVLLELMDIKFGGILDAMSRSFEGVVSTFRGVRQMAFHKIFESTLKALSPMIMMFNDRIINLAESGAFDKIGEKIARFAVRAIGAISRLIHTIRNFDLRKWAMDNMGILAALGTVFAVNFGVRAVSAIHAVIQAMKLMPMVLQKSLGIMGAAVAGWQIGRLLDNKFDISHHVAKWMLSVKAMAGATADLVRGRGQEAVDARVATLRDELALIDRDRERAAEKAASAAETKGDEWIKKAFEKYQMISAEDLASMVEGLIAPDAEDINDDKKSGWRDIIDERTRRGIGKVFGGGAMVEGTEEKRTKAALDMVKRQGKTNELLEKVVQGFNIDNRRIGALAF
jgi:hypothetical protein